jgi:CRISPR-associated protein Csb2
MLALSVTLLAGCYEASLGAGHEWPPHPGRLFSALVAQAEPDGPHDAALRWLQTQPAPVVLASEASTSTMQGFVPTNASGKDTHQTYLGRTSGERSWHRVHPRHAVVHVVWESADPPSDVLTGLRQLSRRVPYLGRSTSPVMIRVDTAAPGRDDRLLRWESPGDRTCRMRVPHLRSVEALREAYDNDEPARSVDRWVPYGQALRDADVPMAAVDGPWPELLTFGLPSGTALDGRLVVRIATAWRKAVLSALRPEYGERAPELALLHGHDKQGGRSCAFLALPTVGHEHADGQVRGLGLAVSPDLPEQVRRSLLRVLGMDIDAPRLPPFHVPGLLEPAVPLVHGSTDGRVTFDAGRWTGRAGATTWSSVTPVVLDRFPRRREDYADHVVAACALAGYPEPIAVDVVKTSSWRGAAFLRRSDLQRRADSQPPPSVHCRLAFGSALRGPVVLGQLRHLGLGLCLPEPVRADWDAA